MNDGTRAHGPGTVQRGSPTSADQDGGLLHSIASGPGPVVLADAVETLLELSDERDAYLDRILAAELRGYQRGRSDGYAAGYVDAIAEVKGDQHDIVRALQSRSVLWLVRGQKRARNTFADPHHRDYKGGAA